jgi:hypothetical protein
MIDFLRIEFDPEGQWLEEGWEKSRDKWLIEKEEILENLANKLRNEATVYQQFTPTSIPVTGGGPGLPPDIVIAFISGGALTAIINVIFQTVSKYLSRHESREVTLERGDNKITLKGRSTSEEIEMIKLLFPEVPADNKSENTATKPQ